MKAIILSAGQGKRLFPLTEDLPKCLVKIDGLSILEWQLEVLCGCGIDDVVVVTGFQHEKIESVIEKRYPQQGIRTLYNPDYRHSDNMISCWKSIHEMDGDFILLNGDTLFEPQVLKRLINGAPGDITITISKKARYDADDMKVIISQSSLERVGKELPLDKVNGESIGLSLYRGDGPRIFRQALDKAVRQSGAERRWYLSVIDGLARQGLVKVVDVTGLSWCEIDFPRDLKAAKEVVTVIRKRLGHMGLDGSVQQGRCVKAGGMAGK